MLVTVMFELISELCLNILPMYVAKFLGLLKQVGALNMLIKNYLNYELENLKLAESDNLIIQVFFT